jgi:hypothetical protein
MTNVEDAGNGLKLLTFPDGFRCYTHSNEQETMLIYNEIFVKHEYLGADIALDGCRCVFDVGANIALFTLKIDAEGDELNILQGISEMHFPLIHQIAAEIHSDALLAEIQPLLARQGFSVASNGGIALSHTMYAVR